MGKETYKVDEIANILGINRKFVTALISERLLDAIDVSKGTKRSMYRIPKQAFENFIRNRTFLTQKELQRRKAVVEKVLSVSHDVLGVTAAELVRAGRER